MVWAVVPEELWADDEMFLTVYIIDKASLFIENLLFTYLIVPT